MKGWGCSDGAIAGVLGNMQAESALIPDRWESDRVGNMSGGYGLVQWTPATKLRDWAAQRGLNPATVDTQVTRIKWEADNGQQFYMSGFTFWSWLKSDRSPEQCADDFVRYYERPQAINSTIRQQFARSWFSQLNGTAPGSGNPFGFLDSFSAGLGEVSIAGWSIDPDDASKAVVIHLYVGGPAGDPKAEGFNLGAAANKPRPDVAAQHPNAGSNHGYVETVKTSKRGSQPIYVYAVNTAGPGDNVLLGSGRVDIPNPPAVVPPPKPVAPDPVCALLTMPVLQTVNPSTRSQLITSSQKEVDSAAAKYGYTQPGEQLGWASPTAGAGLVEVRRLYSSALNVFAFATGTADLDGLKAKGFADQKTQYWASGAPANCAVAAERWTKDGAYRTITSPAAKASLAAQGWTKDTTATVYYIKAT